MRALRESWLISASLNVAYGLFRCLYSARRSLFNMRLGWEVEHLREKHTRPLTLACLSALEPTVRWSRNSWLCLGARVLASTLYICTLFLKILVVAESSGGRKDSWELVLDKGDTRATGQRLCRGREVGIGLELLDRGSDRQILLRQVKWLRRTGFRTFGAASLTRMLFRRDIYFVHWQVIKFYIS